MPTSRDLRPYDERSLERLEWGAITSILAAATSFAPSWEAAVALRPVAHDPSAERRRALVLALERHRRSGVDPHIGGAVDLRAALERAEKRGVLDGATLLAVSETLRVVDRVSAALAEGGALLEELAARMNLLRSLRGELERAVAVDGQLNDAASPLLGGLRAHQRVTLERLRTRLETLAHAKAYSPHLQEAIVTMRNGRYVLPVRAEAKGKVPGIVHDSSATGQTVWIEPLEVVEMGNSAREAEAAVQSEEARILGALTERVASEAPALRVNGEVLAELDLTTAIANVAARDHWAFAAVATDDALRLSAARHPLLGADVVPTTLDLSTTQRVLLITGPNTGGKTVALKTVGLLTAMHEAGLPIPAEEGSAIPPTGGVWADIGDDQSIAQSLSTFSGHLTSILRILTAAQPGDLVLLDEAGAGTDPAEGAALAAAVIDELRARGVRLLATSHYAELKQYAHVTPGVLNGAVEFDLATLRPTYRLIVGTPGGSQAFAIAQRLGLSGELLEAAKARRSDQGAALDASLTAAAAARNAAEESNRIAAGLLQRAEAELRGAVEARREGEATRAAAITTATEEARVAAKKLLEMTSALQEQIERSGLTPEIQGAARTLREVVHALDPQLEATALPSTDERVSTESLRAGDRVTIRSGSQAVVIEATKGSVVVALGSMHATVASSDIVRVLQHAQEHPGSLRRPAGSPLTSASLDVRGARVEEALAVIEKRIDALLLGGGERLEIIHGVGTGALRDAIRKRLRELPEVRDVRDADTPGRDGVTLALL